MLVAGGLEVSVLFFGCLAALCLLAGVLASISGTGGGSLFIPVFSLAFPNDVHRAVPLSKVAVFGVALGACCVNFSGFRGMRKTSSYINYELATLIQPATLLGCLFGVFLNLLLPSIAIVIALIAILSFVAYKTFKAAFQQREETATYRLQHEQLDRLDRHTPSTGVEDLEDYFEPGRSLTAPQHRAEDDSHRHSMERSPTGLRFRYDDLEDLNAGLEPAAAGCVRNATPTAPFGILRIARPPGLPVPKNVPNQSVSPSVSPLPILTRPGRRPLFGLGILAKEQEEMQSSNSEDRVSELTPLVPAHIKTTSSVEFEGRDPHNLFAATSTSGRLQEVGILCVAWAVNALCLAMAGGPAALACGPTSNRLWLYGLIGFQLSFITWTGARLKLKKRSMVTELEARQFWWVEELKMLKYCILSCLAGVCAGLLGIGGGLVKGPLLISIGLLPINAVATSNYMILFTSSTNVLAFLLAGRLDWRHSPIFAILTFLGGVSGATTLKRAFSRSHRQHILTLVLATSIVLGGVAMATVNIREIVLRARGETENVHEKTFAEACEYLEKERSSWNRLKLVDI